MNESAPAAVSSAGGAPVAGCAPPTRAPSSPSTLGCDETDRRSTAITGRPESPRRLDRAGHRRSSRFPRYCLNRSETLSAAQPGSTSTNTCKFRFATLVRYSWRLRQAHSSTPTITTGQAILQARAMDNRGRTSHSRLSAHFIHKP